jgi:tRNA 2-thiocytidine biosynthesis protein TtcA
MTAPHEHVERRIFRQVRDTCAQHELFAPNDKILVAISGGKDSYTMLWMLHRLARALSFPIELIAVHLDQRQPGYDGAPLKRWLDANAMRYEILSEDTYSVVTEKLSDGATYCSLCSRLRRGILYTAAQRLGCNKLALGHHRDDGLETFLLNLFYGGKLQAMPAKFTSDDGRVEVIRPLIECAEADIAMFSEREAFPILPCNLCGSQEGLKRERVAALLATLEAENPSVRAVMANALGNVRPTHLLDRDVRDAWMARPAHIRPVEAVEPRERHFEARPVDGTVRLPVLDRE